MTLIQSLNFKLYCAMCTGCTSRFSVLSMSFIFIACHTCWQLAGPLIVIYCDLKAGSKRKIVPESLGDLFEGDQDEEGDGSRSSGEDESSEEGDDDVAGWEADEDEGVDPAVQAEAVARAQKHQQRIEFKKARQRAQQGTALRDALAR
jgi:hypothetical protein